MSRELWMQVLSNRVARLPSPLPRIFWRELYHVFDDFVAWTIRHPADAADLDAEAARWRAQSGFKAHFSHYFSPYYRNRAGQTGKDRKQIFQMCQPFFQHLAARKPWWFTIPSFRLLAERMIAALYATFAACTTVIHALRDLDDSLAAALSPRHLLPPVAIRLLRYEADNYFCTNAHVDKSAVTIVLDTDDAADDQCLVFAPIDFATRPVLLSEFRPIAKDDGEALVFLGAAPLQAGYSRFLPAPHAVRPCMRAAVRHSAIFFWLLPNVDMDDFDTSVPVIDDLGVARPSIIVSNS